MYSQFHLIYNYFVMNILQDIFSTLLRYSVSYDATNDDWQPLYLPLIRTTLFTFFLTVKFSLSFRRSKKLWTSSFTSSKGSPFSSSTLESTDNSSNFDVISSLLDSMGLGDFGAFLGRVFLTFFLLPDPFLGFCSSSAPESSQPL